MRRFPDCIYGGALLLTVLLSGCTLFEKDSGTTVVEGQVVDKHTGQPVPLAEVQVHAFYAGGSLGGGYGPALGGPYLADATGHFSLSFDAKKHTTYHLEAYGPLGHFSAGGEPEVQNGRRNVQVRVPVQAPAWVRVRLIDEPPRANSGQILVGGIGERDYSSGLPLQQNVTYILSQPAHLPSRISWTIRDYIQSTTIQGYKELNLASLDTVTVDIRF